MEENIRILRWDLHIFPHGWEKAGMTRNSGVNGQLFDINQHQPPWSNGNLDFPTWSQCILHPSKKASVRYPRSYVNSFLNQIRGFHRKKDLITWIWDGEIPFWKSDDRCTMPVSTLLRYTCQTWRTWVDLKTPCLSCHFGSFFSDTLSGHTCRCSWHAASQFYSHVAMSYAWMFMGPH